MEAVSDIDVPARAEAIERAIRASGGQRALARALGIYPQAVNKWVKAKRVPAERVLQLEAISGVDRSLIRPDLYPPAGRSLPQSDISTGTHG